MRLFRRDRVRWEGTTGAPRSSNGASSFHLMWDAPAGDWTAAEAVLEVLTPPKVPALYFWALQVSFTDRGRRGGGAHLGLQWYPAHPGSTAVNWGGYDADGAELTGSDSPLPSATGNPNTRDFPWSVHTPYRLTISRVGPAAAQGMPAPAQGMTAWEGSLYDLRARRTIAVRQLWAKGSTLDSPMVWSEVFADCGAPDVAVRWSGFRLRSADGDIAEVGAVRVNYQTLADGGCATTDSRAEGNAVVQRSGTLRRTAQGAHLVLGRATQQSRSYRQPDSSIQSR